MNPVGARLGGMRLEILAGIDACGGIGRPRRNRMCRLTWRAHRPERKSGAQPMSRRAPAQASYDQLHHYHL
jgi:hypothetical protein